MYKTLTGTFEVLGGLFVTDPIYCLEQTVIVKSQRLIQMTIAFYLNEEKAELNESLTLKDVQTTFQVSNISIDSQAILNLAEQTLNNLTTQTIELNGINN